ncbi:MAG: hypothetical protein V1776_04135 [Candidatus Diapherotrites archaeon]
MAKKGHLNRQKRVAANPIRYLKRKTHVWAIKTMPGTHTTKTSIPLGMLVRDMLALSKTMHETKQLLARGAIIVEGKPRKEYQFPVGLFDTIMVPATKKTYRLSLDTYGRMTVHELTHSTLVKPVKVIRKKIVAKGKTIIQTHDGKTYENVPKEVNVGDSVLVKTDAQQVEGHLSFKKGGRVFIIGGTHVGEIAKITHVIKGTMKRDALVDLSEGETTFQTTTKNVMMIDDETAEWIKTHMEGEKTA